MAKLFNISFPRHVVLYFFVLAGITVCSDTCWPETISQTAIVGFDIGLTHGASVVAFPNGSFSDLALIEADAVYQAWTIQSLHDVVSIRETAEGNQIVEQRDGRLVIIFRQAVAFTQELLNGRKTASPVMDAPSFSESTAVEEQALDSLIEMLKLRTEVLLGETVTDVTLTLPDFFSSSQRLLIHRALAKSLVQPVGCPENSAVAAALAQRHAQFHSGHPNSTSTTECLFGPFGVEEVLSVDYTGDALAFRLFELYVGEQTYEYDQKGERYFAPSRKDPPTTSSAEDAAGLLFGKGVRSSLRSLLTRNGYMRQRLLRLVLLGDSSRDRDLLETLRATVGKLLPPGCAVPRAVRLVLSDEEMQLSYDKERKRIEELPRPYIDHRDDWTLKEYEDHLLALVQPSEDHNCGEVDLDPGFAAARGGTLLGLASRILPCAKRDRMLESFWGEFDLRSARGPIKYIHMAGFDEYPNGFPEE